MGAADRRRFEEPGRAGLPRFRNTNIWTLVTQRAETMGEREFLVWHPYEGAGASWTFGELAADAAALAAGLQSRGIRSGDRVLIHLENCPEFVIAWLACSAIGAVAVTTNTRSAADELRYFIDHSNARAAITQPRLAELVARCGPELTWVAVTDHDSGYRPEALAIEDTLEFRSLRGDASGLHPAPPDASAPLSVQYTSGTTSRPKGVVWTHANGLFAARTNAVHEDLRASDCHLVYMPLFHTNALAYSVLATLWVGSRMVLVPKWSTSRFWSIVQTHRCTWVSLIPLSIRGIAQSKVPEHHSLRLLGGPVCDLPLDARLGVKTVGWWGMTETLSHPIVGDVHVPNRPRSMGLPAPEWEVTVVDEAGLPAGVEEAGELLVRGVRGVSLFAEYLDDPAATAAAFDDEGWFRTGDRVVAHADGHLSFVDRSKDMLKVGGENVAASEIERVLVESGLVREAAVVSRRDPSLDEVPVAFVVPRSEPWEPGLPAALREHCVEHLADFKVPREVHVVAELPRSTINKVHKLALREVAAPEQEAERANAEAAWIRASRIDPSGDESAVIAHPAAGEGS